MTKPKNEKNTENIVRNAFRKLVYYELSNDTVIEEQKSGIEAAKRLLKDASKTGRGGNGSPEFILSSPSTPDLLVIVECKADVKFHISQECAAFLRGEKANNDSETRLRTHNQ
ncbi:MAG: hypothetical protein H7Y60_07330 [Rhodospirillaceae bacterium]|nr:hypothetical protein [Rhodospirillales bacterium]